MQRTTVTGSGGGLQQRDVLENRFPEELIRGIWEILPLQDLIAYGNTCRLNRLRVQDVIRQSTDDEIRRFCTDPEGFRAMLWSNKSMVSGSVALAALVPSKLRAWKPHDMDVYTSSGRLNRVLKYLEKVDGYKMLSRMATRPNDYPDVGGVREVVKVGNRRGLCMDVVVSDQNSIFGPVFRFYGSHVFNGITGRGLISMYPGQTLAGQSLWNFNARGAGRISIGVQKSVVKYTARGYNFAFNSVLHLDRPHECGHSRSCPHTHRNMFDRGVLALVFPVDGVTEGAFVPNSVGALYNGRHGNLWCLGGYPCRLDENERVEAAHFLEEGETKDIMAEEVALRGD
jgi:hypothetical protein